VISGLLALSGVLAAQGQPLQLGRLRANGTDLTYGEQGKGTPVVFVHGAVGDLRFWEPQREAFAKGHRFVAYSYRYHGSEPWLDDGKQYSAQLHAADLAALITALKAGPVHLVGLSYGGLLATMVATKEPQLVRSLTLAEPALFGLLAEVPEGKPALEAWAKGAAPMIAALKAGDAAGATKLLSALVNGESPADYDRLPAELRQILNDNARTLPLLFAAEPATIPCDTLRGVRVPTLIVRGVRTPDFFVKINERVNTCIPGSRAIVIPGAAHAMSYQNPSAFNRAVLDFLSQQSQKPGTQRPGN
jgi:pimeloyl-ACP methyl ester carboxylesterase